ncbi:tape measure protein, partial [bacterium]|nr:tape measure protein [bacterium]
MGGTSVDTARMVETVAGALRLGNASTQEAESAMRQFGQAMAKGKLNGDEFVSLMENAPYLMDAVAASLGKTKGDLFAMAEAGQLTAQVFGDAVLGSFDAVTGKADTLAPTIGQAMERITTAFTVAASESKAVGLASTAAFSAMGIAADHAGLILGALANGALVLMANQLMTVTAAMAGKVTATLADRAANVANLQSTVASAEATALYTGMVLREAQATLASTTGLGA